MMKYCYFAQILTVMAWTRRLTDNLPRTCPGLCTML